MKKASNFAASSFWMKDLSAGREKLASGMEPGYRHAPVWRETAGLELAYSFKRALEFESVHELVCDLKPP